MKSFLTTAAAAVLALGVAAPAANASVTIQVTGVSNTLTETGGGGLTCLITSCGIEASTAAGALGAQGDLSKVGDSFTFDFLTFDVDGTTGLSARNFDLTAAVEISPPDVFVGGVGDGSAFLLGGNIVAGELEWTTQPGELKVGDGRILDIQFEDGVTFLAGSSETISATVTLAAVPLPAAGFVLLGALAGAGAAYRRRKAA